jgi:hypothetical protein
MPGGGLILLVLQRPAAASEQRQATMMRKLMVVASAAAMLAASSLAALADDASGVIASLDLAAGTVTLDDGTTYVLPAETDAATLQVGQRVQITYDEGADGTMTATEIEPEG